MITTDENEMRAHALNCGVPTYMIDGLLRYVLRGVPGGSFLNAVVSNDLIEALARADDVNQKALPAYGRFLYNHAPSDCFKSPERVSHWIKIGGLIGLLEEKETV